MGKHILARQNGNAIQYVQVTKTGGTKITTDPTNATLFDSVVSAERQKRHAPKNWRSIRSMTVEFCMKEFPLIKKSSQSYSNRNCNQSEWIMQKVIQQNSRKCFPRIR